MPLPKQIAQEIEEADRLQAEITEPQEVEEETPETEETVEDVAQETENEVEDTSKESKDEDAAFWKQKYKTLQGMFDAEVPRLHAQLKESNARIESLEAASKQADDTSTEPTPVTLVSDSDIDAFGPELVDLQKRVAKEVLMEAQKRWDAEKQQLLSEISQLKENVGTMGDSVRETAQDRFLSQLTAAAPTWEAVNEDSRFLKWLAVVDPMTGVSRQTLLDSASAELDVGRTSAIFNAFINETKPAQKSKREQDLQRQVVPAKAGSAEVPDDSTSSKIWTQKEIQDFYDGVVQGRIGSAEAATIENEINMAMVEDRVR